MWNILHTSHVEPQTAFLQSRSCWKFLERSLLYIIYLFVQLKSLTDIKNVFFKRGLEKINNTTVVINLSSVHFLKFDDVPWHQRCKRVNIVIVCCIAFRKQNKNTFSYTWSQTLASIRLHPKRRKSCSHRDLVHLCVTYRTRLLTGSPFMITCTCTFGLRVWAQTSCAVCCYAHQFEMTLTLLWRICAMVSEKIIFSTHQSNLMFRMSNGVFIS